MTRWPTTFDSHVWPTEMTPVAIEMKIIPPTSQLSSVVSPSGIAWSRTSRSRNGVTIPSPALIAMSSRTVPRRAWYGRNRAAMRRVCGLNMSNECRWLRVQLQLDRPGARVPVCERAEPAGHTGPVPAGEPLFAFESVSVGPPEARRLDGLDAGCPPAD